jgi:HD domain
VFLFGSLFGEQRQLKFDPETLYVGAMFHDLGLMDAFSSDAERFEVDGANAARDFLGRHGIADMRADLVWLAIALHTTPGIAQHLQPEIALVRAGVRTDVVGTDFNDLAAEQRDQITAAFPRHDFENGFIDLQACSALKKPQTTFGTINVDYIEYKNPGFRRPNQCEHILTSPWRG